MEHAVIIGRALLGMGALLAFCWALSENRSKVDWRLVVSGVALQFVLGLLILRIPQINGVIEGLSGFFYELIQFSNQGAELLFGKLTTGEGVFGIAFTVLPTIIFFSAFSAALYYLRVLPLIVYAFAWLLSKTMRLSGAECLAAAANIFIGQTEAPLVVKPYLGRMSASEVLSLMTGGMATIAGGVLALYMTILGGDSKESVVAFGQHLLTASILSAPAAMVAAKIMSPQPKEVDRMVSLPEGALGDGLMDAVTRGVSDGIRLALNVGGMLIAFTALMALLNWMAEHWIGSWTGLNDWATALTGGKFTAFNFSFVLGVLSMPFAWLIGVSSEDVLLVGQLLGERLMLNEFVAYLSLAEMMRSEQLSDPRSIMISTYALCGFANVTSVGIQIGGISSLEPGQRPHLLKYGMKSLLGGMAACYMTAIVATCVAF